ncbi:MAG: Ferritin Dps family protein [Thermotoga sp. 50_1627]|uniref:ferritin n=1 Tax=Pseudothermotoga sp. TaxID=2033661 RepID=UPI00076CA603|nr:MAG: Ferritin Dps family protein [Thermotoga sp. 50_64]KUK25513.1 MAG: Ferritin Dps family protein [Thermotoga sp. 50_1627]MBC7115787.1 ferritin [Pseudothermotoga sp.]HBT38948.1 ferritin [Pseudothermotoga sp.]HCO97769.1 ferritin [Pseudothermotoga sp.]
MIPKEIEKAFNEQIKKELDSAYLYLSMAAYFEHENLEGMAHWMKKQAQEEVGHAMKFFEHINERGGRVELHALDEPKKDWASPLEAFKHTYDHEQKVTASINNLVELAKKLNDNASLVFLNWFVNEQIEEEANAQKILSLLERIEDNFAGIIMLDTELAKRE